MSIDLAAKFAKYYTSQFQFKIIALKLQDTLYSPFRLKGLLDILMMKQRQTIVIISDTALKQLLPTDHTLALVYAYYADEHYKVHISEYCINMTQPNANKKL